MKAIRICAAAVCLLSFAPSAEAASPAAASKLHGFHGKYIGRLNYAGFFTGRANASISAPRSEERATISLRTVLFTGGVAVLLKETIRIRGRRAFYVIETVGPGATIAYGRGSAKVTANSIRYNSRLTVTGLPYVLQGTIRKGARRLTINEILFGTTSIPIRYTLFRRGA